MRAGSRRITAGIVGAALSCAALVGCSPLAAVPHAGLLRRVNAERTENPAKDEPAGVLPLPVTRPVLDPAVDEATLAGTVCAHPGARQPPAEYTAEVLAIELSTPVGQSGSITDPRTGHRYRVPGYRGYAGLGPTDTAGVELDALLPVAAGGDGFDPANLWPERAAASPVRVTGADGKLADSTVKDRLDAWTVQRLCPASGGSRRLSLAAARTLYEPDWYATYVRLGLTGR